MMYLTGMRNNALTKLERCLLFQPSGQRDGINASKILQYARLLSRIFHVTSINMQIFLLAYPHPVFHLLPTPINPFGF